MSGSLGVEFLGETYRKLQAIHTPCTLPGVNALSPPSQYMHPWAHSYTHTHIFSSQVILTVGSLAVAHHSRAATSQRDPGLHPLQPLNSEVLEHQRGKKL